jgi:hypothetical protein
MRFGAWFLVSGETNPHQHVRRRKHGRCSGRHADLRRSWGDVTFLSPLHCQSGAIATVRTGLQSGQFSAETGVTEACKALVTDDTA